MRNSRRAWSWLALGVVTVALALALWHEPKWIGIDFHTYLAAAVVGLQYGWSHIYDQALVAVEQKQLVPSQPSQPFLSPPTVAWLVAPLTLLPYEAAHGVWMGFIFVALAAALAWSGVSTGTSRWIAVIAALAPWWVLHAVNLGQVVPLVAAGAVVGWRLLRQDEEVAAGLVLSLIFLKPNTAILVPFALLAAGRYRALAAWLAAGGMLALVAALTLGHGMSAYVNELRGPLPSGADALTLRGALGASGLVAFVLRLLIVAIVLTTAFKLRSSPGLVVPVGIVGSLLVSPYLHASDLCLLSAAAWIVWEERPVTAWRAALAVGWILASPFLFLIGISPRLNRWPWLEFAFLVALAVVAWRPLTRPADLRTRAPA
ncbi:MAG: glycosyltransferase family 87 protein [Candidatus Dormibacteraceae bacterium]